MEILKKYLLVSHYYIILAGLFLFTPVTAQDARFTVVLDAGHGGHDPGAMSSSFINKPSTTPARKKVDIEKKYNKPIRL